MRIDHATPPSPTVAPAAGRQPRVVVAVHEGVYGAASGTGFSNRAFLTALARILPTGRLSVITPHVPETSGTHDRRWTREVQQMLKKAQAQVITIPAVPAPPGSVHGAMQLCDLAGEAALRVAHRTSRCLLVGLDAPSSASPRTRPPPWTCSSSRAPRQPSRGQETGRGSAGNVKPYERRSPEEGGSGPSPPTCENTSSRAAVSLGRAS